MDKLEGLLFRFGIYRCQEGYDCILAAMERWRKMRRC